MEYVPKMAKEAAEEAMDRNVVVSSKTLPHIVFATGMESVEEHEISDDRRGQAMAVAGARDRTRPHNGSTGVAQERSFH
jgi:hypothetical protein